MAGRGLVLLLSTVVCSEAWAAAPSIQLPDSDIGRALGVLAAKEIGSRFVVYAPTPAPLRVTAVRRDGHLMMVVTGEDNGVWAERRFALDAQEAGALRAAVALLAHARQLYEASTPPKSVRAPERTKPPSADPQAETETDAATNVATTATTSNAAKPKDEPAPPDLVEPPPGPPPAPPSPPKTSPPAAAPPVASTVVTSTGAATGAQPRAGFLRLAGQAALAFNHASPALGLQVRAQALWRILHAGFVLGVYGLGCCGRSVQAADQTALEGSPRAIDLLLNVDVSLVEFGSIQLGPSAAGGAEYLRISASPVIFAGPAPATTTTRWSPIARLGAWAGGPIASDWLRWRADLGLQLRFRSTAVALPAGFPAQSEPLTMGRFVPVVAAGLEGVFF